ncbi:MAG TPA: DUF5709 domain-containing protein [Actinospica sp.]|nr:DUF5709 domain-containing protein [Actinospica sp.]
MNDSDAYAHDDDEDDGVLEPADDLSTDELGDDPLDTGIAPPDKYGASNWYGITEAEGRQGETLDQLLAEEEPDPNATYLDEQDDEDEDEDDDPDAEIGDRPAEFGDGGPVVDDRWPGGPGPRSGRLVGDGRLTATDVGVDAGAAGAEEAAVHLEEENEIHYRPLHD